jgi:predicted permease
VTRTIEHVDDVTESDTTFLIIAIIGIVVLVILTIMCCMMTFKGLKKVGGAANSSGANTSRGGVTPVPDSSFRSANPSQAKLDDMM